MADIVQLEEKGSLLYPKTHTSAIDDLDVAVVKKTGNETVAGVKNFKDGLELNGKAVETVKPYKTQAFTTLLNGATGSIKAEKKNGYVTLYIGVQPNAEPRTGNKNILSLPEVYRLTGGYVQYGCPLGESTGYPENHGASIRVSGTNIFIDSWSNKSVKFGCTITAPAANDL